MLSEILLVFATNYKTKMSLKDHQKTWMKTGFGSPIGDLCSFLRWKHKKIHRVADI